MIDYNYLKFRKHHYLEGDETLIENYDKAIADKSQMWVCHHRRELDPDRKTINELIELGLYWNQPPEALIFMTKSDHMRLHGKGNNNPMAGKSSWEKCTSEQKAERVAKFVASIKGKNNGKTMWNNGKTTVFSYECPPGFVKGMLRRKTSYHWYNDGKNNILIEGDCPPGFVKGRKMNK